MRLAIATRPNPDTDGLLPLYLRVEHQGKTRYVALGLRVHDRDWNPKKREVRASRSTCETLARISKGLAIVYMAGRRLAPP